MYKVIRQFKDTDERIYNVGDDYNGTAERIEVLVTGNNAYKQKYIEFVENVADAVDYSKLKVDELKVLLNEKEIPFDEKAVKADLVALLGEA